MRTLAQLVGVALCLALVASSSQARSLRDTLAGAQTTVGISPGQQFDALAQNIADTAARSIPVLSSSAGFTYSYNPKLEVFERTSDTLGPLFLERPDTLGKGKFNVNVSYQFVQFDQYDGDSVHNLHNPNPTVFTITDSAGNPIGTRTAALSYSLKIQNYITAISATYGVLDNLDVNMLVPLIATNLDVGVHEAGVQPGRTHGSAFGIGDILLRAKYQLPRQGWLRSAAGLQLRLPSGNEDDFQGTGAFEASPFVYASTLVWGRLEPHANLGVDLNANDVDQSQLRYGIGADIDATKRLGFSLAFLGRTEFSRSAPRSDTLFLHSVNGTNQLQPLLGLDFGRKDFFDLSFGARAVVWRDIMLFVNGIYALNNEGLRNDTIIPTVGFEGTF